MKMLCAVLLLSAVSGFASADMLTGRIVGIVDGDTVDLLIDGRENVRVRVAGIDAPERSQAFGQRSKQRMSEIVFGKAVQVESTKRDRYGRVIGKVMVNGRDAGLSLIDSGLAWHYKKYQREQSAADREIYSLAEDKARSSKVGLWRDSDPTPPWEWRKGEK